MIVSENRRLKFFLFLCWKNAQVVVVPVSTIIYYYNYHDIFCGHRKQRRYNNIKYGCSDVNTADVLQTGSKMFDKGGWGEGDMIMSYFFS